MKIYTNNLKNREFDKAAEDTRRSGGPSQCKAGERSEPDPKGALNLSQAKPAQLRKHTKEQGSALLYEEQAHLNKLCDACGLEDSGCLTPSKTDSSGYLRIYRPSELQAFLKERGMHPKKGLSQNFLIDGNIVQKIVDLAAVAQGDSILEIGSGPGALTQALLERGAFVTAIEMDPLFAKELQRLQTADQRLDIIVGDVLQFPLLDFLQKQPRKYKVVANLPYHITTPILTLLLPLDQSIESLTIMVQKEFADRMTAEKNTAAYSSFTLFLQFYAAVQKSFTVSPNCFYPRPKVHSAVVHCKLHPPLLESDSERFFQLTRTAFGKRRKMLRASLKELYPVEKIEQALVKIGYTPKTRPEELTIYDFIALLRLLCE